MTFEQQVFEQKLEAAFFDELEKIGFDTAALEKNAFAGRVGSMLSKVVGKGKSMVGKLMPKVGPKVAPRAAAEVGEAGAKGGTKILKSEAPTKLMKPSEMPTRVGPSPKGTTPAGRPKPGPAKPPAGEQWSLGEEGLRNTPGADIAAGNVKGHQSGSGVIEKMRTGEARNAATALQQESREAAANKLLESGQLDKGKHDIAEFLRSGKIQPKPVRATPGRVTSPTSQTVAGPRPVAQGTQPAAAMAPPPPAAAQQVAAQPIAPVRAAPAQPVAAAQPAAPQQVIQGAPPQAPANVQTIQGAKAKQLRNAEALGTTGATSVDPNAVMQPGMDAGGAEVLQQGGGAPVPGAEEAVAAGKGMLPWWALPAGAAGGFGIGSMGGGDQQPNVVRYG